jgi:putative FmdB family regulatory protein
MPTYEYHCTKCGHEFEVFHSITADPIRVCPKCSAKKVERKIGIGGAVIFKGGGFYETDYRSESYTKAAEAERQGSKPSETPAAETKDAKPSAAGEGAAKDSPAHSSAKSSANSSANSSAATKAPASGDKPAPHADAAPAKSESSKATHPSRVGRGMGNIVQNPPKPKASTSAKPAKAAKVAKVSRRGKS